MRSIPFAELKVGDTAEISKLVTEELVHLFADISEDRNPVHLDPEYAKGTFFKQRIAHGMLGAALISAVLGTRLPGPGAIYLAQDLKFKAPVHFGDTLTARVEVVDLNADKKIVTLRTTCLKQDETLVIDGTATIKLFA